MQGHGTKKSPGSPGIWRSGAQKCSAFHSPDIWYVMGQNPRTVATLKEAKIAGQWRILVYMMISHRILSYSSPFSGPKRIYWKYLEILEYVQCNYIVGHHIGHMMSIMPLSSSNKQKWSSSKAQKSHLTHCSPLLNTTSHDTCLCWAVYLLAVCSSKKPVWGRWIVSFSVFWWLAYGFNLVFSVLPRTVQWDHWVVSKPALTWQGLPISVRAWDAELH